MIKIMTTLSLGLAFAMAGNIKAATLTYKAQCFFYESDCMRYRDFFDIRDSYKFNSISSQCKKSQIDPNLGTPQVGCKNGEWGFVPYVQFHNGQNQARVNKFRGFCSLWSDQAKRYSNFLNQIVSLNGKSRFQSTYRKVTDEEKLRFRHTECQDARYMVEGAVILDK